MPTLERVDGKNFYRFTEFEACELLGLFYPWLEDEDPSLYQLQTKELIDMGLELSSN